MCLYILNKEIKKRKYGWKVFRVDTDGSLYSEIRGYSDIRGRGKLEVGKWLKEIDYRRTKFTRLNITPDISYPVGWHVFHTRRAAEMWRPDFHAFRFTIRKVRISDIVAQGKQMTWERGQHRLTVSVCKRILIEEE